jgi:hypothetical protein
MLMASSRDGKVISGRQRARRNHSKRVKLTIRGDVQDIGFRLRLLAEAQRLSLPELFADDLLDMRTVVAHVVGMTVLWMMQKSGDSAGVSEEFGEGQPEEKA